MGFIEKWERHVFLKQRLNTGWSKCTRFIMTLNHWKAKAIRLVQNKLHLFRRCLCFILSPSNPNRGFVPIQEFTKLDGFPEVRSSVQGEEYLLGVCAGGGGSQSHPGRLRRVWGLKELREIRQFGQTRTERKDFISKQ